MRGPDRSPIDGPLSLAGERRVAIALACQPFVGALAQRRVAQGALPTLADLTHGPMGAVRAIAIASVIGAGSAAVFWWMARAHLVRARHEAHR